MTHFSYQPRVVEGELADRIAGIGAVVIEGPKACGKTATARRFAASELLFDVDPQVTAAMAVDPTLLLAGDAPRLLDEWQLQPGIWNYVRRAVDDRREAGQFILTGSAVPTDDITRHSGAGRISRLRMRPMSLFESGHSTGDVSLAALIAGAPVSSPDRGLTINDLAERIVVGGWPALQTQSVSRARATVQDYVEEICRVDISRVENRRRDPQRVMRLMRSLARNTATYASSATLAADWGGAEESLNADTVREYIALLERLFVVEDQPAWAPHLRSRSKLRSASKRHFADPSIAAAALASDERGLIGDLNLMGLLFESLVIRDLRIYSQALGGRVSQYRDNTGLEIDAILELPGQAWAAFEIKLGAGMIETGAQCLARFLARVDTSKIGAPVACGVIVGNGLGYVRKDGIAVIPIGTLGP